MEKVRSFIEPIRKKWVYHFIVSPKTSIIEKPEWYLNQTLKWIHEHIDAVEAKVKLDPTETKPFNVKQMFILCMVELAMMRLSKDMTKISKNLNEDTHNKAILTHTYNEVIQFTKVIRQLLGDSYGHIDDKHDMMSTFCNQTLFERIIDVEWESAEKNLKDITNSNVKLDPVLEGDFVDNYKIPKCVDRLLMLSKSITDRVECFRQLDCQFQLIELQCFLFNKFLSFLKKSIDSSRPASVNLISDMFFLGEETTIDLTRILRILNGVNFLRLVLKEKNYISYNVIDNLDKTLKEKSDKLAEDYKIFFYKLVDKVVSISECVEGDLQQFLDFIKPKLSHHIYEIIRDEAMKNHQARETQHLLGGLSFGGE